MDEGRPGVENRTLAVEVARALAGAPRDDAALVRFSFCGRTVLQVSLKQERSDPLGRL